MDDTQPNIEVETSGEYAFTAADAEKILFVDSPAATPIGKTPRDLYHQILNLKKRETDLFLHGTYLSNYHRQKLIPRGFRVRNIPTLGRSNPEFCSKWCKILNKCSLDLTLLVIEFVGKELKQTKNEITEFETQHLLQLSQDKSVDWLKNIESNLNKYKQDLVSFKEKKLTAVREDYRQKKVYRWLLGLSDSRNRRVTYRNKPISLRTIDSSGDSTDSDSGPNPSDTQAFLGVPQHPPTNTNQRGTVEPGGGAKHITEKPPRRGRSRI